MGPAAAARGNPHAPRVADLNAVALALLEDRADEGPRLQPGEADRLTPDLHFWGCGDRRLVRHVRVHSGYAFGACRYVDVRPEKFDRIPSPKEKAFDIEAFLDADAIDPACHGGRTWYLLPEGKPG